MEHPLSLDDIKTVGVVGAGQMGAGIAQVLAMTGFNVSLYDAQAEALERGIAGIGKRLERLVEKDVLSSQEKEQGFKRVLGAETLEDCGQAELVIEAIVENPDIKFDLFAQLDGICRPETILASNTSSISITKIAAATNRPDRVMGMHFMNPVPLMQLVELIRGLQTSNETYKVVFELTNKLGKTPVTAHHDYPGFIVNRILIPMLNEACFVLMEGIASPEDIDTAMTLGTNQPMGPLTLADFVGLDTCLAIAQIFHRELGDDKYRPCPLLVKYVEAGWLGRKTARGFYDYSEK